MYSEIIHLRFPAEGEDMIVYFWKPSLFLTPDVSCVENVNLKW